MPFQSSDVQVLNRQLKVERLVIPFSIVGNSTSTSVVPSNDEPALMFIATEGVDQITGALASNETATYTTSANDTSGIFQVLVKINEPVAKVLCARFSLRDSNTAQSVKLGSSTGITTGTAGGNSIMLVCTSSVTAHSGSTANGCLEVEYALSS